MAAPSFRQTTSSVGSKCRRNYQMELTSASDPEADFEDFAELTEVSETPQPLALAEHNFVHPGRNDEQFVRYQAGSFGQPKTRFAKVAKNRRLDCIAAK